MSTEQRQHKRYKTTAPIFIDGFEVGELRAQDLSQGGVFVSTRTPLGLCATIKLEIVIPENQSRLEMDGEVVHSMPGVGMGIRFTEITADVFGELTDYLKELERQESGSHSLDSSETS